MKLYATVSSERGKEVGKGGTKEIAITLYGEGKVIIDRLFFRVDEWQGGYELWRAGGDCPVPSYFMRHYKKVKTTGN